MNPHRISVFIAVASLSLVGARAPAPGVNDVRCLLASSIFANGTKDGRAKLVAEAGKFFYLGRIDGRLNQAQLKAALMAEQRTITAANVGATVSACAQIMKAKATVVQGVSQQLGPVK